MLRVTRCHRPVSRSDRPFADESGDHVGRQCGAKGPADGADPVGVDEASMRRGIEALPENVVCPHGEQHGAGVDHEKEHQRSPREGRGGALGRVPHNNKRAHQFKSHERPDEGGNAKRM